MRRTLTAIATVAALSLSTVAPAVAAEPAKNTATNADVAELSSKTPALVENAGPFGLLAVMGAVVLGSWALLKLLGEAVK